MHKAFVFGVGLLVTLVTNASAAEIHVLSANAAKLLIEDLVPPFERLTKNTVIVSYDEPGIIRQRILAGEKFDLTILPTGWDEVRRKLAHAPVAIGHTDFGMAVAATTPKPDTSSVAALKQILLASRSIVYTDPRTGGITGVLFAQLIERLDITEEINKKSQLVAGMLNATLVVKGKADLAVQLSSDILVVPGVQFLPMPPEFQTTVTLSGAVASDAAEPERASYLLQFLTGRGAVSMLRSNGFEPG